MYPIFFLQHEKNLTVCSFSENSGVSSWENKKEAQEVVWKMTWRQSSNPILQLKINALVQKQWILDIHLTGMCLNLLALKKKKYCFINQTSLSLFHIVQLKIPSSSLFTSKAPILPWLNTRKRPTYRWFDLTQLFVNSCDVTVLKQKENTVS
jgi:hypothetical protein